MEHHAHHSTRFFCHSRCASLRCFHAEGKGMKRNSWQWRSSDHKQITYDLHQLPDSALEPLRDSLLVLLQAYTSGPRPIRTQLCVCIASLAIQMSAWKNVIAMVGSAVGNSPDGLDALLDFLRILPEEVTEGRKINLSVRSTIQHSISSPFYSTPATIKV